jgi:hypothetical protein
MNIPGNFSQSLDTVFKVKILKFFNTDPGSEIFVDPGSEMGKFGSGTRDKQPRSATLTIKHV